MVKTQGEKGCRSPGQTRRGFCSQDIQGSGLGQQFWLCMQGGKADARGDGAFTSELLEQVKELELQGVLAAESGNVNMALERFSQAIWLLPERASCYNNRAQALRLKGDVAGALQDLDTALRLSRGTGRVACQCFVQRGLINVLQGHEDNARQDFEQGARLGSAFARHQLVLMNPYSALCNQMLLEMMRKLQNPDIQGSN
ncbi:tetratricopeptide repeat protein 36 isoform X1 [Chelonia mydas]|uniref:tetratricopeptide repeat protein 36 isoform X1 n=1 Tax=Chelonia mydas TaxID=8469 RepID=UPI001CA891FD|nr:tetratricopeptide repeat protein 36 isoform X1 [Chelonia mydas]XP_043389977.1 tetratricopeptide repeat protein 36 isoform X1 [Chelonia mydas]XP_043389978.1 tetratricopeptide repeat protein 36 isoform X1 [Chelonia mydas]